MYDTENLSCEYSRVNSNVAKCTTTALPGIYSMPMRKFAHTITVVAEYRQDPPPVGDVFRFIIYYHLLESYSRGPWIYFRVVRVVYIYFILWSPRFALP